MAFLMQRMMRSGFLRLWAIAIDMWWNVRRLEKRLVDVERVADYVKFKQRDISDRRKEWI